MKIQKHNPDYKLISVVINGKELVYGETNTGGNKGLEVYYLNNGSLTYGHYLSRRYEANKIPMLYNELYSKLQSLINACPNGSKLELTSQEYKETVSLN